MRCFGPDGHLQCELCRSVDLRITARRWALAAGFAALLALAYAIVRAL